MSERKPVACKICKRLPAVLDNMDSVTIICPHRCMTICEDTREEAIAFWNKVNEEDEDTKRQDS